MWIQNVFELVESQGGSGERCYTPLDKGGSRIKSPRSGASHCSHPTVCFCSVPQALGYRRARRTTWSAFGASPASWASLPLGKAGASRSPSTAETTAPLLTVLTVSTEPLFSSLLPAEGSFLPLDLGAVREGGHGALQ